VPRGAAVIRRGETFSIKYQDHEGKQVWERLGKSPQWNQTKAERELGKRLDRVEREQWRKPTSVTLADFADRFQSDYLPGRNLKPSTASDYASIIRGRLVPFFGELELVKIDAEKIDAYIAHATAAGLQPKTVKNHLGLLRVMFKVARRWRLVHANPTEEAEAPRIDEPEMSVLSEAEIGSLLAAYRRLEHDADEDGAAWWRLSRHVVEVALGTAMRRGEILGLSGSIVSFSSGACTSAKPSCAARRCRRRASPHGGRWRSARTLPRRSMRYGRRAAITTMLARLLPSGSRHAA
jgi:integrase